MKIPVAVVFAVVGVVAVTATEDYPANMPACGKTCGDNMLAKAGEFNCTGTDVKPCICEKADFGYGIHDCNVQSCPDVDQANIAIGWANNMCANAGKPINIPSATTVGAGDASATPVATSSVVTTIISGSSTFVTTSVTTVFGSGAGSSETVSPTPITTSTWTSVFTSGSLTTTLTGETTVSGVGATSASQTTVTSPIVSTQTSGSSTFETTVGSTTIVSSVTGDASSSAPSSEDSGATSTSSGQGAQMTAAPALGVLAAAGIAVALL